MGKSDIEETFEYHLRTAIGGLPSGIHGWDREYTFHPGRRWRLDFAWPALRIGVELEGGLYVNGRHTRGSGAEADMEKYNQAVLDGWRILRFSGRMVESGRALAVVEELIGQGVPVDVG